jgi:hypothetical protein
MPGKKGLEKEAKWVGTRQRQKQCPEDDDPLNSGVSEIWS